MSAYHTRVGIIKGWLMAKDAPDTILTIVDELAESTAVTTEPFIANGKWIKGEATVTEGARKIVSDLAASAKETAVALGKPFEKFQPLGNTEQLPDESAEPAKKKYKKLTPEEKHAIVKRYEAGESSKALADEFESSQATVITTLHKAGVQMRPSAAMANKAKAAAKAPRPQDEDTDTPTPATSPPPRKDSDPDRLIHDQADYIGTRTDRTLVPMDWGDIQKMRYNGLPDARIAKSYGVAEDYLLRFIKQMEERDKEQEKNF